MVQSRGGKMSPVHPFLLEHSRILSLLFAPMPVLFPLSLLLVAS